MINEITLWIIKLNFPTSRNKDIPLDHLKRIFAVDAEDENQFEDNLEDLFQEGWLNQKRETQEQENIITYKMHALVQDVVFEKLKPDEENCGLIIDSLSDIMQEHLTISYDYIIYAQAVTDKIAPLTNRLALLNGYLSDMYQNIGKLEFALVAMEMARKTFELCDDKFNLAASYSHIGSIHQALGSFDQALKFFELEIALSKELYEANPKSVKLKYGLAVSYYKLAGIYDKENKREAKEYYKKALVLLEELYSQIGINSYKEMAEDVKGLIK
jgi:tetratricopeptide (TPR) repeat protein